MKRWKYFFTFIGSFMLLVSVMIIAGIICDNGLIPENIFIFTMLMAIAGYYLVWLDILSGEPKQDDKPDESNEFENRNNKK